MRLFIIFIFLTFVVLKSTDAAPQSSPTPTSPIEDKSVLNQNTDDFYMPSTDLPYKVQGGIIGGAFNDNSESEWHFLINASRKSEFAFERTFTWGASLVSNESVELKLQTDLTSLFLLDSSWNSYGIGFSQFLWGRDGVSNLVNINQSKITAYADFGSYVQIQVYYGLKGLAYSLSLQYRF